MATDTTLCPFCNAVVPLPPGARTGQRAECPRCGESFTLQLAGPEEGVRALSPPGGAAQPQVILPPAPPLSPPPRSNWKVASVVLAGMLVMAVVGLGLALWSQSFRRGLDTRPQQQPLTLPTITAPADLDGLRWLPEKTNLIAGVHYAELWHSPGGKPLLTEPIQPGGQEVRLGALVENFGLKPDEVDHLVLGWRADELRVLLVIRTRVPYDAAGVRGRLKNVTELSVADKKFGKKTVYRFEAPQVPLLGAAHVWFADDRTFVVGLLSDHLAELPPAPAGNLDRLPPRLRAELQERMDREGPLWLAGDAEDWDKTLLPLVLRTRPKDELEQLKKVRTFGLWVQTDPQLRLKADLDCQDAAAAESLESYLLNRAGKEAEGWKHSREGARLTLQVPTDPAKVRQLFKP